MRIRIGNYILSWDGIADGLIALALIWVIAYFAILALGV